MQKNKWLPKIKGWIDENDPGAVLIPFSGAFENKLIDMPDDERQKYLKENSCTSNLDKVGTFLSLRTKCEKQTCTLSFESINLSRSISYAVAYWKFWRKATILRDCILTEERAYEK